MRKIVAIASARRAAGRRARKIDVLGGWGDSESENKSLVGSSERRFRLDADRLKLTAKAVAVLRYHLDHFRVINVQERVGLALSRFQ